MREPGRDEKGEIIWEGRNGIREPQNDVKGGRQGWMEREGMREDE